MTRHRRFRVALAAIVPGLIWAAGAIKIKKVKSSDNPPAYVSFSRPLSPTQMIQHAQERLTFGPRPGSAAEIQQIGIYKWIDRQLHPEQIAEDPKLLERLQPFESLNLNARETYLRYPPRRAIVAYAQDPSKLPDDPQLRAVVIQLVRRYYQRRQKGETKPASVDRAELDDFALEAKSRPADFLTPAEIEVLRDGKPEEKRQVLASVLPQQATDFALSLNGAQRKQLSNFAPVALRRQLLFANNPESVVAADLTEAKLLRAIYSRRQLAELLDDFWFNHFNVFLEKGADRFLVTSFERDAIRPHLFGKFYDLLLATAQSPAMLFYLDNWQSVAPGTMANRARNPVRGLNENYGRELLELHTLGVTGGYTQKDVTEVARCFTGWTIAKPQQGGGFEYRDRVHDKGQKVVLGHVIKAGGGMDDGLEVLRILSKHPATAHFVSLKLAQRFVADDPPPSLVKRMAATFLKTDGDLREVMRTMLTSGEFWSQGGYRTKVKMPLEMAVSAVRATNADVTGAFGLAGELQKLGEPLYRKVEPTGYTSANTEWISSAALLERMNFALALANGRVPGVTVSLPDARDPFTLARSILDGEPSEHTRAAIQKMLDSEEVQAQLTPGAAKTPAPVPDLVAGLTLGSPEFQRH